MQFGPGPMAFKGKNSYLKKYKANVQTSGQPEVGPYLKNYTTDYKTFFSYKLLRHKNITFDKP